MADIKIPDSAYFYAGAAPDLKIRHDGTNSAIRNDTGTFTINNYASASMILATANTTAVTIDNSQNTTFAGDVYVSASGSPSFRVTDTTNTVTGKFQADDTVGKVGTHTNHAFEIFTNNSTRVSVANNGPVTISENLIVGSARTLTVGSVSDEGDAIITNGADGGRYDVLTVQEDGNARWNLSFEGSSSTNSLTLNSNSTSNVMHWDNATGNVGIGTAAPGQLLEVANSGNAYLAINANLGGGGTDNAGLLLQEHQNDMWTIRNEGNSSNRLAILDEQFDDGVIMAQGGTGFSDVSDERVKTNLVTIADAVDKVNSLRAVNFKWKYGSEDRRTKNNVGIIAQDVYKVLPEAVTVPKDDYEVIDHPKFDGEKQAQNMWTVDKGKLVPLLIKAVQELSAKVEALENA